LNRPRPIHHDPLRDQPVRCKECGYDLRGAVAGARCPECGGKIQARSSSNVEGMRIHSIHETGLSQVAASQIGSFIPLAGFLLIHTIGPILAVLTAFGPCYRLLALHIRYRTSEMRRFEPAGFGRILLILAWLESLAALAVVATLVGVIPSAAWWSMTLIYTLAATLSVATTNFLIARATAGWGSTIAPKVFCLGGVAALLAGAAAIGGRMSLILVPNQSMASLESSPFWATTSSNRIAWRRRTGSSRSNCRRRRIRPPCRSSPNALRSARPIDREEASSVHLRAEG
jgi:DNA-directed RNA polymerase subunit RPC12/RpoP